MTHEKLTLERGTKTLVSKPIKISVPTAKVCWKTVKPTWRS